MGRASDSEWYRGSIVGTGGWLGVERPSVIDVIWLEVVSVFDCAIVCGGEWDEEWWNGGAGVGRARNALVRNRKRKETYP